MFKKIFLAQEVVCPCPGAIYMYITEFSITPIWAYFYACFSLRTPKIHCHGFSLTPCFFSGDASKTFHKLREKMSYRGKIKAE